MWKNVHPVDIRYRDSNSRPLEPESPPMTTRPGLQYSDTSPFEVSEYSVHEASIGLETLRVVINQERKKFIETVLRLQSNGRYERSLWGTSTQYDLIFDPDVKRTKNGIRPTAGGRYRLRCRPIKNRFHESIPIFVESYSNKKYLTWNFSNKGCFRVFSK